MNRRSILDVLRRKGIDERYLLHRYKSTSHAGIAAALVMATWSMIQYLDNRTLKWDFLVVLAVMVFVKLSAFVWYSVRD